MRKLRRNNNLSDYQDLISQKRPSISMEKTKMSSSDSALEDYDKLSRSVWFRNFIIDVENKYCPYCEINRLVKGPGNFQIDHIKSKMKFQEIAIAWNNLIPSCTRCNLIKGNSEEILNPLKHDYSDIKFEFLPDAENFTEIRIWSKNQDSAKSIIKLGLQNFYTNMLDDIKQQINDIKDINLSKNNSDEYIGYNNIFGRLLQCYDDQNGF